MVLEFAATVDEEAGLPCSPPTGAPIDLLIEGLRKIDSPYALLIEAVAATLPAPSEHDLLTARRLAMQGPPAEAVGLDPYPMAGRAGGGPGAAGPGRSTWCWPGASVPDRKGMDALGRCSGRSCRT